MTLSAYISPELLPLTSELPVVTHTAGAQVTQYFDLLKDVGSSGNTSTVFLNHNPGRLLYRSLRGRLLGIHHIVVAKADIKNRFCTRIFLDGPESQQLGCKYPICSQKVGITRRGCTPHQVRPSSHLKVGRGELIALQARWETSAARSAMVSCRPRLVAQRNPRLLCRRCAVECLVTRSLKCHTADFVGEQLHVFYVQ